MKSQGLKISKLTKFKGHMSKASEDISPISRDVYRRLYREGTNLPHTIQTSVKLRDFAELYLE